MRWLGFTFLVLLIHYILGSGLFEACEFMSSANIQRCSLHYKIGVFFQAGYHTMLCLCFLRDSDFSSQFSSDGSCAAGLSINTMHPRLVKRRQRKRTHVLNRMVLYCKQALFMLNYPSQRQEEGNEAMQKDPDTFQTMPDPPQHSYSMARRLGEIKITSDVSPSFLCMLQKYSNQMICSSQTFCWFNLH